MPPNFALLDVSRPEVARLIVAMVQARDAVELRTWSHPQEPTGEAWWADVLADPRARKRERRTDLAVKKARDDPRRVQQVRLAGRFCARRTDRRPWRGPCDAQFTRPPRRTGLSEARLDVGPLRGALRRAGRGRLSAHPYIEAPPHGAPLSGRDREGGQIWQQRTNVWREVTNPGRARSD
jgi:hypothetical protein